MYQFGELLRAIGNNPGAFFGVLLGLWVIVNLVEDFTVACIKALKGDKKKEEEKRVILP